MAIKITERAIVRVPSRRPMATRNTERTAPTWLLAVTAVALVCVFSWLLVEGAAA